MPERHETFGLFDGGNCTWRFGALYATDPTLIMLDKYIYYGSSFTSSQAYLQANLVGGKYSHILESN